MDVFVEASGLPQKQHRPASKTDDVDIVSSPFFPCVPPVPASSGNISEYTVGEQRAQCCSSLGSFLPSSDDRRRLSAGRFVPLLAETGKTTSAPAVITPCSHNQVLISTNLCSLCGERLQHSRELLARAVRRCYWPAWLRINKPLFNSGVLCARGEILTML